MNSTDYLVIAVYLCLLLGIGFYFRHQTTKEDYFLGGRSMGWFPLNLSAMATQLGAISFISAPAFVGIKEGGGMLWLSYELGVPLAMFLIITVLAPKIYNSGVVSIYEFIERRFGLSSRLILSLAFQLSRGLATGFTVYAVGLILESAFGVPFWQSLIVVGVFTVLYSLMGGMKAVVFGDAVQMVLIVLGTLVCLIFGLQALGGVPEFLSLVDTDRLTSINPGSLGFSGDEYGLLPMVFGGLVLYASYYGCDQTQAQRILAAKTLGDANKMLMANGFLRFPITLIYCTMGLVVGTLAVNTPEFLAKIPSDQPDRLIPIFIIDYLPHGIIGLVIVALLSAAMSSLSSAINSLAAVTLEDGARLFNKKPTYKQYMRWSRITAFVWGAVVLVLSLFAGQIGDTVIEGINKVGSLFYGPILALFLMAILSKRMDGWAANAGLIGGLMINAYMWAFEPQIFWFWWNFIGCVATISIAYVATVIRQSILGHPVPGLAERVVVTGGGEGQASLSLSNVLLMIVMFFMIIGVGLAIQWN